MNDAEQSDQQEEPEYIPRMPGDWRPPQQVLLEQKWNEHPERERLVELSRERDERGEPKWALRQEPEPEDPDWTVVWFGPVGPRDERPRIRIVRYPNSWLESERARVEALKALDDEHLLD